MLQKPFRSPVYLENTGTVSSYQQGIIRSLCKSANGNMGDELFERPHLPCRFIHDKSPVGKGTYK